jgi:hypothetical protein
MFSAEKNGLFSHVTGHSRSRAVPGHGPFQAGAVAAALVSVFDIPPFRPGPARKTASQAGDGFASEAVSLMDGVGVGGTQARALRSVVG